MKINWTQVKDFTAVITFLLIAVILVCAVISIKVKWPTAAVKTTITKVTPGTAKVKVIESKIKKNTIKTKLEVKPTPISKKEIETWFKKLPNGRSQLIDTVHQQVNQPVTIEFKSDFKRSNGKWSFGGFMGPSVKGWGLTHSMIKIPYLEASINTGIIVGRDETRALIGQWTAGLSKEIFPQLSLYIGAGYSVKYAWQNVVGVKYDF